MKFRQKMQAAHDAQLAAAATEARVDITGFKLKALAQLELPHSARATNNIFSRHENAQAVYEIAEWLSCEIRHIAEHGDRFFFADERGGFGFYGQIRHVDGRVTGAMYLASDDDKQQKGE